MPNEPVIVALDFETANYDAFSACQLGLVRLEGWSISHAQSWLIRPPFQDFAFTHIHGLTWNHVKDQPSFKELWGEIKACLQRAPTTWQPTTRPLTGAS